MSRKVDGFADSGHSIQIANKNNSEEDGLDECAYDSIVSSTAHTELPPAIVPCDCNDSENEKVIMDNVCDVTANSESQVKYTSEIRN